MHTIDLCVGDKCKRANIYYVDPGRTKRISNVICRFHFCALIELRRFSVVYAVFRSGGGASS